jgi:hypothetical protein
MAFLGLILILFALSPLSLAAANTPKVNETRLGWVAEPDGRGSMGILLSCMVIIGLCVWTALHLNVEPISMRDNNNLKPPPNIAGKCLWAFIALNTPEFVSAVALHQYFTTRRFCQHVNKSRRDGMNIEMKLAFFATMGGIAQVQLDGGRIQPTGGWDLEMQRLTPLRFDNLLKPEWMELIGKLSQDEVEARSKQDILAKVIVCSQAVWLLVQCIARKKEGLPISPLELHTALYVVNLMFMYAAWLQKPVDLGRPILMNFVEGSPQPVSIVVNQDVEPEVPSGISDVASTLTRIMESLGIIEELERNLNVNHTELLQSLNAAMDKVRELRMSMIRGRPNDNIADALEIALREMTIGM